MSNNDTSASARSSIVKGEANMEEECYKQPSVSISVFVCWIVPVLLVATLSRFTVHTGSPAFIRPPPSRPVPLNNNVYDAKTKGPTPNGSPTMNVPTKSPSDNKKHRNKAPVEMPTVLADKPTGYQEVSLALFEIILWDICFPIIF
jgi:hypothetical protein